MSIEHKTKYTSLSIIILLTGILLLNVWGSYHWVQQNIVMVGHDASGYLATTLEYQQFLDVISVETIFKAFTHHHYRPPAFFIGTQFFYSLFGVSMDGAQMLNIFMLAVVLLLTFWLGRQVASPSAALYATLFVGLLPMMSAMSRLFYTEMFLTATVVLNLLALYKCNAFANRRWSVVYGISLGVGLLVKWTMPIYIGLPLLWVLWRHRNAILASYNAWQPKVNVRGLMISLGIAIAVSLLWFWPNRTVVELFPAGNWMLLGWILILWALCYGFFTPSVSLTNGWIAVWVAIAIASLWYLPYADFVSRLLETDQERGQVGASILTMENHTRYLRYIYEFHFGALAFWTIIPLALFPWLRSIYRRSRALSPTGPIFDDNSIILWLSLISAYAVLLFLAQRNARNLVALLPGVAILATLALWQYPKIVRRIVAILWVSVLLFQWAMFTFDSFADVHASTGDLWVHVDYSVWPSSNQTDYDYWIGPQILERIATDGDGPQSLGMLVNSHQFHRGMLRYLIALEGYEIDLNALSKEDSPGWSHLLASQWVLTKEGHNGNVEAPGQQSLTRINNGDPIFHTLYRLVETYPLPNGETVSLYHRNQGPGHPLILPERIEQTRQIAAAVDNAWSVHATLFYADRELAIWVGLHDPVLNASQDHAAEPVYVLDPMQSMDEQLGAFEGTLMTIVDHQSHVVRQWLAENTQIAAEIGNDAAALVITGRSQEEAASLDIVDSTWPLGEDVMTLSSVDSWQTVAPGQVLPVQVQFGGQIKGELKVSLRLVAPDGEKVAQNDRGLTDTLRAGLFVPPQSVAGMYTLAAVVYDPNTLEPILDGNGQGEVPLATVMVD